MILSVDVHYDDRADEARAAGIAFIQWTDGTPEHSFTRSHRGVAPYQSGAFYQRELPCIMPLIREAACLYDVHTVVVDGFVDLGEGRLGLGRHLFVALAAKVVVVGVAKSAFAGAPALPAFRGSSRKPLWVTSTGDVEEAAQHIGSMAGAHRLPDLLKLTDSLARGKGAGGLGLGLP